MSLLRVYLPYDMSLGEQTGIVTSPIAASPPQALVEKQAAVFKSGLYLTFHVILDPSLPVIGHKPSGNEVVIVSIELIATPGFSLESVEEKWALQDLPAKRTGTTRHARGTAVDAMRGRYFEVPPLDIGCAKPVIDTGRKGSGADPLDSLARANGSDLFVFKGSQEPWKDSPRPCDIIICHDDDLGPDLWNSLAYLNTLVGNWGVHDLNVGCFQRLDERRQPLDFVRGSDKQKLVWIAS